MAVLHWIVHEVRSILLVTLYFAACFGVVIVLKQLLLAEYGIEFSGLSMALVAALVTAKVVIVLEKIPLTKWLQGQAAMADIIVRSTIYTVATLLLLLLERAIESRAEYDGVREAIVNMYEQRDVHKAAATTICVGLAFLAFNAFRVIHREIGGRKLAEIFLSKNAPASALR